jgi:3-phosphoshikimate 1-carboxyvinyltransferase
MSSRRIAGHRGERVIGTAEVPGDKSIAHRALVLGSMARGTTYVKGVPEGEDLLATFRCLAGLGVECNRVKDAASVIGVRERYAVPKAPLECGGSATTMRLLMGALAGMGTDATLCGDETLSRRPMRRVARLLEPMGAQFEGQGPELNPPVRVVGPRQLHAANLSLDIASAQLKSAAILAALCVPKGRTTIKGAIQSRDHTERLVLQMGGSLVATEDTLVVERGDLQGVAISVPGDPSSAAFFATAATLLEGSRVTLRSVGTNSTRMGFFEALSWMGGDVTVEDSAQFGREPVGNITVRYAQLRGIEIHAEVIPFLIDEIPLLLLLATQAEGETLIHGISELRIKESDRISCSVEGLHRMGAEIDVREDCVRVAGPQSLKGATLEPWGDHRMSMTFTVAALAAAGDSVIRGVECEAKSYPTFYATLEQLLR